MQYSKFILSLMCLILVIPETVQAQTPAFYRPKIRANVFIVGADTAVTKTEVATTYQSKSSARDSIIKVVRDSSLQTPLALSARYVAYWFNQDSLYYAYLKNLSVLTGATYDSLTVDRTTTQMKADTLLLYTFSGGNGNAGDTTDITTTTYYDAFYNDGTDTLVITKLHAVMMHGIGTDTLGVQISWDDTLGSASATNLNTVALPINSITIGTTDVAFSNTKIPPGYHIWCTSPTVVTGRKPTRLAVTLSGYRIKAQ